MLKNNLLLLLLLAFSLNNVFAQESPSIKFGKINAADFIINSPVVDSNANAVVIADIGTCEFEGNNKGWFSLVYTEHKRIKIINKNGFSEADINIGLYKSGDAVEKLTELKAITYNLENGSVVQTKLDDKNVFNDKLNKNFLLKKFTFPAVKEGSVIEYTYTIKSDFILHLHPWEFQGESPCLWSSYTINVPAIFNYAILKQGATNYVLNRTDGKSKVFRVSQDPEQPYELEKIYAVSTIVTIRQWAMKDIPAMHSQDYTSSIDNYVSKLDFQLSEYRFPDEPIENKLKDWKMLSTELLKSDDFGQPLIEKNIWVTEELKNIIDESFTDEQKAKKIFAYVRDNYVCTKQYGIFLSEETVFKDIIKKKSGSVSDLNLLLVSMLRLSGLKADPVILSTREHGTVMAQYPLTDKFNYLICRLQLKGTDFYLDASSPYLGFDRLTLQSYNGMARIITDEPAAVYFKPEQVNENKTVTVTLTNNNNLLSGEYIASLGYHQSLDLRNKLASETLENYFKEEEKNYSIDATIKNGKIDSLKNYDVPVIVKYTIEIKPGEDDRIYFNPMLNELIKNNPFKSEERLYPVELPYNSISIYNLNIEIPKNYKVEELPKPQTFVLGNNDIKFEYQVLQFPDHIQVRTKLQFNKTFYDAENYDDLRKFFGEVIKKENEQIIFKKLP